MVVITIIGILTAAGLSYLGAARAKVKNSKRTTDLLKIQKGLELYLDTYGYYPNMLKIPEFGDG